MFQGIGYPGRIYFSLKGNIFFAERKSINAGSE
jgi:hypothetical protein